MAGGLARAMSMFSVIPVRSPVTADRAAAARALLWLPALGALLGALAGLPAAAVLALHSYSWSVAAVVAVGTLTLLTRGLHLDGLADTADGLGSGAAPQRALEIMRRSDIGPFGVVTLVLVLLLDVVALASLAGSGDGGIWRCAAVLAVAAATGRLAAVHAGLVGIPGARGSGFGSLVAGSVKPAQAVALTVAVLGLGALLAALTGNGLRWPAAQGIALVVCFCLRWHAVRRFGGVTGDVFGALIECGTAATLALLVIL
jgi:adenosylcobinamide-GDP ribazoletransferase